MALHLAHVPFAFIDDTNVHIADVIVASVIPAAAKNAKASASHPA
jgi:hypothetical protein